MKHISEAIEIWEAGVTEADILEAISYSTVSLPWTFDRMGYGGNSQNGINERLFHIRQGVLNQSILQRVLTERGLECKKDWTHYRDSDVFDFSINNSVFDVKTFHVISSKTAALHRDEFSRSLVFKQRNYPGPEWRSFFPLMVALTQVSVNKHKDGYIFGISESWDDLRNRAPQIGDNGFWCTAPFGKAFQFFQSRLAIEARENAEQGFKVSTKLVSTQQSFRTTPLTVTLFGEWCSQRREETVHVSAGRAITSKLAFTALSCIRVEHPATLSATDQLEIAALSRFKVAIPKPSDPVINLNDADFVWVITRGQQRSNFIDLRVPDSYRVFWLGHIPLSEFYECFKKYRAYFIPHPSSPTSNTAARLSPDAQKKFAALDKRRQKFIDKGNKTIVPEFAPLISSSDIHAGIMMVGGAIRPLGAACYFYPPYALRESAMYILPADLYRMTDLN